MEADFYRRKQPEPAELKTLTQKIKAKLSEICIVLTGDSEVSEPAE